MKQRLFRVTGRTLDEAHEAMRARFGEEAIVLSSRQSSEGGLFGFFAKNQVELTVSVSDRDPSATPRVTSALERKYQAATPKLSTATPDSRKDLEELLRTAQHRMNAQPVPPAPGDGGGVTPMRARTESTGVGNAAAASAPAGNMVQFPQPKPAEADSIDALKGELREMMCTSAGGIEELELKIMGTVGRCAARVELPLIGNRRTQGNIGGLRSRRVDRVTGWFLGAGAWPH